MSPDSFFDIDELTTSASVGGFVDYKLGRNVKKGTGNVCPRCGDDDVSLLVRGPGKRRSLKCNQCGHGWLPFKESISDDMKSVWLFDEADDAQSWDCVGMWLHRIYEGKAQDKSIEINIRDVQDYYDMMVFSGKTEDEAISKTKRKFGIKDLHVNAVGRVFSKDVPEVKPGDHNDTEPPQPVGGTVGGDGPPGEEDDDDEETDDPGGAQGAEQGGEAGDDGAGSSGQAAGAKGKESARSETG